MLLKVPRHSVLHAETRRRVTRRLVVTTIVLLLPSLVFAARHIERDDITGFEQQGSAQLQALGDEATLLFPQIERISHQSGHTYQEGSAAYGDSLTVTLRESIHAAQQETLTAWLRQRYPLVESIEIITR